MKIIYKLSIALFLISVFNCTPSKYMTSDKYASKYNNHVDDGYRLIKTWYHYSVETNGSEYIYKQFFPTTMQITQRYSFKDSDLLHRNGLAEEWYDNGSRISKGYYINNLKEGEWEYYAYESNTLFQFGKYQKGLKEGTWTTIDTSATIRATHSYKHDKKNGPFKYFDEDGNLFREGIYENDELSYDTTYIDKNPYHFHVGDKMPVLIDCPNLPNKQRMKCKEGTISSLQIHYPEFERRMGIEGQVIVRFVINERGKIENLIIIRGLSNGIKKSVMKAFPMESIWEPGIDDGKPVKVLYSLPISFKLSY